MKRNYYIFSNAELKRKQNTLYVYTNGNSKPIPIEGIDSLYCFGETTWNSKLINFLSKNEVVLHFFNYYDYYTGSFYPREHLNSGALLVEQAKHYFHGKKRVLLARAFVSASLQNISKTLMYYNNRGRDLQETIDQISSLLTGIPDTSDVPTLMSIEGRSRDAYYQTWNDIITADGFFFEKRVRRPPDNKINTMISFCNSLVYTTVLSQIYQTQLNPTISYLHEPGERRFSLSLDLSEIFKPLLADRMIFKLINNGEIQEKHFDKDTNQCLLNESGRKIVLREYDQRLQTTIKHRGLGRNVSYQRLIKLECYKLIKHLLGDEKYAGFVIWW